MGDADVADSLRMTGPIISAGDRDPWLDELHARSADGLHYVVLRTTTRQVPEGYDSEASGVEDLPDRCLLHVWYAGPHVFATYDTLNEPARAGGRVEQGRMGQHPLEEPVRCTCNVCNVDLLNLPTTRTTR